MLVELSLRLNLSANRARSFGMAKWIEDAVEDIKATEEQERVKHERRVLNSRAVRGEMPQVWHRLSKALQEAVQEFNQLLDARKVSSISPLQCNATEAMITITPQRQGRVSINVIVIPDPENECFTCRTENVSGIPGQIQVKSSNEGTIYLQAVDSETKLTEADAAAKILTPLFQGIKKSIL